MEKKLTPTQIKKALSVLGISEEKIRDALNGQQQIAALQEAKPLNLNNPPSLFESCEDALTFTIEIDNTTITDFQKMRNSEKEDIRKTLIALINYYNQHSALNVILTKDALATRQSHVKYTAQLAQYIRTHQTHYPSVKVQFDEPTGRLGIFCRTEVGPNLQVESFIGVVTAFLMRHQSASVDLKDVPLSYIHNQSQLKAILKYKLGVKPKTIRVRDNNLEIFMS